MYMSLLSLAGLFAFVQSGSWAEVICSEYNLESLVSSDLILYCIGGFSKIC